MWSCRKADKYGGKNSTVIKTEMQSWINAQRRYCADPRLDRTRDASLKHQRKHGAARKQLRSTLNFFSLFFFWWRFFLRSFQRKITIMGSVSKYFSSLENRTGTKFFPEIFFFRLSGSKSGFRSRKVAMMGSVSKRVSRPNNTRGEKKIYPRNF